MTSFQKDSEIVSQRSSSEDKLCEQDVDLVEDFQISAPEELLESSHALKHEAVYAAEFLVHKYGLAAEPEENARSNECVKELKRMIFVCLHFGS